MKKTKRPGRIEIYPSGKEFRWRLLGGNGEIMLAGEGHPSKSKVDRALRRARHVFGTAIITYVMDTEDGEKVKERRAKAKKAKKKRGKLLLGETG